MTDRTLCRIATAAIGVVGLMAVMAAPTSGAQASEGRHAAAAAGAVGGLALGAALGAASQQRAFSPGGPVYEEPAPVSEEDCYIQRRRVWVEGYGWQIRRQQVCD